MIQLKCERGVRAIDVIEMADSWALHNTPAEVGTLSDRYTITHIPSGLALQTALPDYQMARDLFRQVVNWMPQPENLEDYKYLKEVLTCWAYAWDLIEDTAEHIRNLRASSLLLAHISYNDYGGEQ